MNHFPKFPSESGSGYVYFAKRPGDVFKIGSCKRLERRAKSHKTTDSDFDFHAVFELVEYKACESFLKAYFEGKRKNGTSEMFVITEGEIEEAVPKAISYSSALQRGRSSLDTLRSAKATSPAIASTEELCTMHGQLKSLCAQIDALQSEVDLIKLSIALVIGESEGIEGLAIFKDTKPRFSLVDSAELAEVLKAERPDLYQRFWQETFTRPLRIL